MKTLENQWRKNRAKKGGFRPLACVHRHAVCSPGPSYYPLPRGVGGNVGADGLEAPASWSHDPAEGADMIDHTTGPTSSGLRPAGRTIPPRGPT